MTIHRDMTGGAHYRSALKMAWSTPKGKGILGDALTDYRETILPALDRHYVDLTGEGFRTGGFIVKASGELVGVFSSVSGRGDELVDAALKSGATHLDCFDGYLPEFYARHGFVEYHRDPNWTPGGPDVVLMGLPSWIESERKAGRIMGPLQLISPKFPEGTPEYAAYAAELRVELDKFSRGEAPYDASL